MFVRMIVDRFVGTVHRRIGAVVDVPEDIAGRWVREDQAVPAPDATAESDPPLPEEKPKRETATLKPKVETRA